MAFFAKADLTDSEHRLQFFPACGQRCQFLIGAKIGCLLKMTQIIEFGLTKNMIALQLAKNAQHHLRMPPAADCNDFFHAWLCQKARWPGISCSSAVE